MDPTTLLHAVDDVAVAPYDPAAVRRTARAQRTHRALRGASVASLAGVVGVAGAWAGAAALRGPDRVVPGAPPATACPDQPWRGAAGGGGPADRMLTPGPASVVVCVYDPGAPPRATVVAGDDPVVARLVADLNALPVPPPRIGSCPVDRLDHLALVARYADGHAETVHVNPDGCRQVGNGTRESYFAPFAIAEALRGLDARGDR